MDAATDTETARAGGDARTAWRFVPVLYVASGAPYFVVDVVANLYLPLAGVPLGAVGRIGSLLTLPWQAKAVWSPLVDLTATKRAWTLWAQVAIALGISAFALAAGSGPALVVAACAWIAIASATHDVAADGFYLLALSPRTQEEFVGIRSTAYRLGRVLVAGGVVYLAGRLEERLGDVARAWSFAFAACAAIYAVAIAWNAYALPRPAADGPAHAPSESASSSAARAALEYLRQPRLAAVLAFILLYRFGESMLLRMVPAFLRAPHEAGGLGLSTDEVGLAYGTLGIVALVAGGIAGGVFVARIGLARALWPMAVAMHVPNLLYVWAAHARPGFAAVCGVLAVEQLAYGFGFAAYMVFLMQISRASRFATTHYAISTGLMGLGAMLAGYWSGDLVETLGFERFFALACATAIPSLATLWFVPIADRAPR